MNYNGCSNTIYLAFDRRDGSSNGHCAIFGQSGTGKSCLIAHFAKSAAASGCEVIMISDENSVNTYLSAEQINQQYHLAESVTVTVSSVLAAVSNEFTDEQLAILDILSEHDQEYYSSSKCIDWILDALSNEPDYDVYATVLENVKQDMNTTDEIDWNIACSSGKITVITTGCDDKYSTDTSRSVCREP